MNRRLFLRAGGASLGGLLLGTSATTLTSCATSPRAGRAYERLLPAPDQVRAHTESGILPLSPGAAGEWAGHGVTVQLRPSHGALQVWVDAPGLRLESVTITWKHGLANVAQCLGDAWERAYGDLAWTRPDEQVPLPWYVMVVEGERTSGFGVKTGCRSMASWRLGADTLSVVLDTRSGGMGVRLGRRRLLAAELVARRGGPGESAFQVTRAFCRQMCDRPKRPRHRCHVGMLDWYFTYGKCTDTLFLEESTRFAELVSGCGVQAFSLVDAGWAPGDRLSWHEDQTVSHPDFGSIENLAGRVRALGLAPGLWTRVLCTHPRDPENLRLPRDRRYLDPSLPETLDRTRRLMRLFRGWGYEVIKHDFTTYDIFGRWGPKMGADLTNAGWSFHDDSRTTAEIILDLYQAIRDGCGDDGAIIGCNTVSHLSAGLVEYCRVGDDSGNDLERAMKYGPNPFAFRLPQNDAFYTIDPDCVGNLREIPWRYTRTFVDLVGRSGALLQLSTRLKDIRPEERETFRTAFQRLGRRPEHTLEPLDWRERAAPSRWQWGRETLQAEWGAGA